MNAQKYHNPKRNLLAFINVPNFWQRVQKIFNYWTRGTTHKVFDDDVCYLIYKSFGYWIKHS